MYRLCFRLLTQGVEEGITYSLATSPVASGSVIPYTSHQPMRVQVVPAAPQPHPNVAVSCIRSATGAKWEHRGLLRS